jgi:hypothetical protein
MLRFLSFFFRSVEFEPSFCHRRPPRPHSDFFAPTLFSSSFFDRTFIFSGRPFPLFLPQLIRSGNIRLANLLLDHDASVTLADDAGADCIAAAEEEYARCRSRRSARLRRREGAAAGGGTTVGGGGGGAAAATMSEWADFIAELKRRGALERARDLARDLARSRANEE